MNPDRPQLASLFAEYRQEVLRWNKQMNLVSRVESPSRIDDLIDQCGGALESLLQWVGRDSWFAGSGGRSRGDKPEIAYFDLGSGAGLPGLVWHSMLNSHGLQTRTGLVEPRQKRSWFLDRMKRLKGMPPFSVLEGRWGEVGLPPGLEQPKSLLLISLKALRLDDVAVLGVFPAGFMESLNPPAGEAAVLIARFYPPGQIFSSELQAELGIPSAGETREYSGTAITGLGGLALTPTSPKTPVSLIVSPYSITRP